MPRLRIDNRDVEVPEGATILEAARRAGIAIPTLCHLEGLPPSTSCMVCVVKVRRPDRLVPSCGAPAEDGMVVESETDEVREARRDALELLLSDHLGDCEAPCRAI
jgi:NADH dehydrogenase/NADH:ubiquinone oxidoreductase subunit G